MKTIGEKIREIRVSKGLTQDALGKKCEPQMADSAIRRYENDRAFPKIETIQRIAKALEVSYNYLITGTDYQSETSEPYSDMLDKNASLILSNIESIFTFLDKEQCFNLFGDFLRCNNIEFKAGQKDGKMGKYFSFDGGENYKYFLSNLEAERLPEITITKIKSIIRHSSSLDDIDFDL